MPHSENHLTRGSLRMFMKTRLFSSFRWSCLLDCELSISSGGSWRAFFVYLVLCLLVRMSLMLLMVALTSFVVSGLGWIFLGFLGGGARFICVAFDADRGSRLFFFLRGDFPFVSLSGVSSRQESLLTEPMSFSLLSTQYFIFIQKTFN